MREKDNHVRCGCGRDLETDWTVPELLCYNLLQMSRKEELMRYRVYCHWNGGEAILASFDTQEEAEDLLEQQKQIDRGLGQDNSYSVVLD